MKFEKTFFFVGRGASEEFYDGTKSLSLIKLMFILGKLN